MRGFAAVFRRELAERRLVLLVGLAGLVPVALPLFPGISQIGGDLRSTTALVTALLTSTGLAVLLGSTAIGSELSQGRLGFYFSRPISGRAIWAGKLGAAFALSFAAALLVALPEAAIDGLRPWGFLTSDLPQPRPVFPNAAFTTVWFLFAWAALTLLAVLAAHSASVMIRARSALLALDLGALAVVAGLLVASRDRLGYAEAEDPAALVSLGALLLAFAALGAAGAAQVVAGRTDARRGHRILSLVLWTPLLAGAIAAWAFAGWVLAATPADLTGPFRIAPSPAGSWLTVRGEAAHRAGYEPDLLIDTRSGRYLRLPPRPMLRFSADGRHAAWLAREGMGRAGELFTADLAAARVVPVRSRFGLDRPARELALSPDGARVAAAVAGRLLVADLATGRLLAAAPLDYLRATLGLAFTDPSHVRFHRTRWPGFETGASKYEIVELDLATGRLEPTGAFTAPAYPPVALAPDGRRLVFRDRADGRLVDRVLDAHTGLLICDIQASAPYPPFLLLLSGDRYAELVGDARKGAWALAVYGPDGRALGRFPLASNVRLGGQPDAGHFVYAEKDDGRTWALHLLDLATGATRLVGRDLRPLDVEDGRLPPPNIFWRSGWKLVRVDLATGAERAVAGGGDVGL